MISTDFAPNEQWDDAWISLKLLLQLWRWRRGAEIEKVKEKVLEKMLHVSSLIFQVSFFLTGRSALFTILKSLNLPKGSEVIVQAFTCEAVILPILENGLKPVYVDIESDTFSMNPIDFQKKISNKTGVVILQHTFGIPPAHRTKLYDISKKHNLVLIEDIAHGYSIENNEKLKAKNEKLIFFLSFGRSKALSSVFGGAVVTNDVTIHKTISQNQTILKPPSMLFTLRLLLYKPISSIIKSTYDIFIGRAIHKLINLSQLLIPEITLKEKAGEYDPLLDKSYPNALAVLLSRQLDKYEQMQKNRALICEVYRKQMKNKKLKIKNLSLLRYPILVDNPDSIRQKAAKQNIFLGNWYNQVIAPKVVDLTKMQYKKESCPRAENICKQILNLPTNISYHEALQVIKIVCKSRKS